MVNKIVMNVRITRIGEAITGLIYDWKD